MLWKNLLNKRDEKKKISIEVKRSKLIIPKTEKDEERTRASKEDYMKMKSKMELKSEAVKSEGGEETH